MVMIGDHDSKLREVVDITPPAPLYPGKGEFASVPKKFQRRTILGIVQCPLRVSSTWRNRGDSGGFSSEGDHSRMRRDPLSL